MAIGKVRNNKRSSSTSYTSTITTVVVIALCVLGVWMLTSDSIISPQSTTRTSAPDEKISTKSDNSSFDDNPGDLPDDAVRNGQQKPDPSKDDGGDSNDQGSNQNDNGGGNNEGAAGEGKKDEGQVNETDQSGGGDENNNNQGGGQQEAGAEEQTKKNQKDGRGSGSGEESSVTQNTETTENNAESGTQNGSDDKENNAAENTKSNDEGSNEGQDQIKSDDSNQTGETTENKPQGGGKGDTNQQDETESTSSSAQEKPFFSDENQPLGKQYPVKPITFTDETNTTTTKHDNKDTNKREDTTKTEDTDQVETTQQKSKTTFTDTDETNQDTKQQDDTSTQESKQDTSTTYDKSSETSSLPNSGIPKESKESKQQWSTQAAESHNEKERRKDTPEGKEDEGESMYGYSWHLCNVTAGADYIPCLDNEAAIRKLPSRKHFEHRERHCPEEPPTCLVSLPEGYKTPVPWPQSRDKIWFHNVPHKELAEVKGHQNWVKLSGEFLTFPGGGTQFIHGALHYIDFIQKAVPDIAWGRHTRVILDIGCGVASFGGYLFERDVLAMSLAPKDEHEAQVQFALERGIPAISAVMGSQRLPFPSNVFDVVHCARCRVPWHIEGGRLLLELNRVLRPGGFFVWSATPVYQKLPEDVEIWQAMTSLTASMCWKVETIQKDELNMIGAAIYRKPKSNECYEQRKEESPPMCKSDDDANAAWYVPLQSCMHRVPVDESERGSKWPARWPKRLATPPYWLNKSQMGIYGKPAPDDFTTDHEHWKKVLKTSYLTGLGFSWRNVRNVMDMRAVYGGFAAALKDLQIWVLNVVNVNSPDTLPIIYERGLFGIYHDWCESFSTYPRTYDLLHADHLFSKLKERCKLAPVMAEIDRIVRPGGKVIVRDESSSISEVENLLKSLHWEVHLTFSKDQEGILSAQKTDWRPKTYASS